MRVIAVIAASLLLAFASTGRGSAAYAPSTSVPPKLEREFRGLWIATVANIDWPSKRGLNSRDQKAELIALLDRAAAMNFNAVIFQVRPACDTFYKSDLEPWSEYLTGAMGKPPEPFYDPLAFAVAEAHKRGMELHAWFNPYRALHKSHEGRVSPNHISQTHPRLVKRFGQYLWLDPGEREVQEHSLRVVMEVVRRYDIDAVHFDDYFYPDPAEAPNLPFPDEPSWQRYGKSSGLSREDWRRANVDAFISNVHSSVKAAKPWVKFGVSPHGIWRPGHPPSVRGSDNYTKLFADSRKWLANGWVDYFSPQLYWTINSKEQSFPALLDWWKEQNVKGRHLWPGMSAANALALSNTWKPDEIPNQIEQTRKRSEVSGYILFSSSKLFLNRPLATRLEKDIHPRKALPPASPWLRGAKPAKPHASVRDGQLSWRAASTNDVIRWWAIQRRTRGAWHTDVLPSSTRTLRLPASPEFLAVTAVDRFGQASSPAVLQLQQPSTRKN